RRGPRGWEQGRCRGTASAPVATPRGCAPEPTRCWGGSCSYGLQWSGVGGERGDDGVAEVGGRGATAEGWRGGEANRLVHCCVERVGEVAPLEGVPEQQRERAQHSGRVGGAHSGDVRRGSVHRLEDPRPAVAEARRRGEPQASGDGGGDVGEDVAEGVL